MKNRTNFFTSYSILKEYGCPLCKNKDFKGEIKEGIINCPNEQCSATFFMGANALDAILEGDCHKFSTQTTENGKVKIKTYSKHNLRG